MTLRAGVGGRENPGASATEPGDLGNEYAASFFLTPLLNAPICRGANDRAGGETVDGDFDSASCEQSVRRCG